MRTSDTSSTRIGADGAGGHRPRRSPRALVSRLVAAVSLLAGLVAVQSVVGTSPAAAAGGFSLRVVSAANNATAVTSFKYLVNEDNTGQTTQRSPADGCGPASPGYPATCKWTSMGVQSTSPVVIQGDQSDFASGAPAINLPDGRYLVSVRATGYKLDGAHFTIAGGATTVTVEMQPDGLPAATIQALVFDDISPTNGAPDLPAERGLAGFKGQINDYLGQVTTDIAGNPLCSVYDANGAVIAGSGGTCLSKCYVVDTGIDLGTVDPTDAAGHCPATAAGLATTLEGAAIPATASIEGKLKIPNVGPNRYALSVIGPNGGGWVQTTTLEGNHDWDAWVMEGATGLDTEFVQGGEPLPGIIFGYVQPKQPALGGTGSIHGVVDAMKVYYPPKGGLNQSGAIFGGLQGAKVDKALPNAWAALTDLTNGDTAVWVGQADASGVLNIPNVPDGNYTLTWWDEPQNYILDLQNVSVINGQAVDLGILPLNGWWTQLEGYVFNDTNRNGVRDPGEAGVPNFTLTVRKRENSLMDRGGTLVTTDSTGHYRFENAYPITQWLVLEAYNDRLYTTGVTYQADNQLTKTTNLADRDAAGNFVGSGVDVSFLPIIGLAGTVDWGVHAYDPTGATNGIDPRNGGIVGTVSYDTTRNELDPRYAAVEDWQPGIPGATVNLYDTVPCGTNAGAPCSTDPLPKELSADGSYAHGALLNTYVTEKWNDSQPTGCVARDINGAPLAYPADQQVLPTDPNAPCLEGPLAGVQFQNGFSNVDGNYGFADECIGGTLGVDVNGDPTCSTGFTKLRGAHDYLVEPVIPNDLRGKPTYKLTREEDVNIANGDTFIPQVPPPACAGPLHTVDLGGQGIDGYGAVTLPNGVTVPASITTDNPGFPPGGTIYEGQARPLCSQKLVTVNNGKSIVPTFNWFTDVPLPSRFWGLVVDDLNFSSDPKSLTYGEKAGVPFAPVGIYDYTNRLVFTAESDYNGLFDVLMPSTNRISCPTPSGVCANVYRFVGNDPGVPGRLNPNFKPQYRTIAAEFEALPGLLVPADLAPTQVGVSVQLPGGQINQVQCALEATTPQLFAVSRPYGREGYSFTINGTGFGTARGSVKFDGVALANARIGSWSDSQIQVEVPGAGAVAPGPHQVSVTASNGRSTVDGITFHVIGGTYNPTILEVGPGKTYAPANTLPAAADHAIQRALDAAPANALVVVYPGLAADQRTNPRGAYFENLVITKPVKLQGVGPGGVRANGQTVPGSIIDGSAFAGDSPVSTDWVAKVATLSWVGNQTVNDGAVITLFAPATTTYATNGPTVDGFDLRGGDQQGFPTNLNVINGTPTGAPPTIVTQGGALFANAYVQNLALTNNVVQNNGGGYGAIRIGTPDLPQPDNANTNVRIVNNRIIQNAGTNLAGAIGLFAGSNNYEIAGNDICGNFSAEYGGGVSVHGLSPNGKIHDNRIYFNASYDEGGGIIIAGQLPANPATLSPGSGPVDIYNNLIQANLGNDDGGGIRFLMAGNFPMNVYNNFIVNNVSTHEGGGIAINDAPDVRVFNNTIMKNQTTATAATSNGLPAPAGLSTSLNSAPLQATLAAGSSAFSNPNVFNNIFWDNRAGTRAGATVTGLGIAGDATPINRWDLGVADGTATQLLSPTSSVLQTTTGTNASPTNTVGVDPAVKTPYDIPVSFAVWRNNPAFIGALLVTVDAPPNLLGDYHLGGTTSPANNLGAASKAGVNAPAFDIDNQGRPAGGGYEAGADEIGVAVGPAVDLSIAKTDNQATAIIGDPINYAITVGKAGTGVVTGATVADTLPAGLTNVTWTCTATGAGSSCAAASGTGSLSTTVTLGNAAASTATIVLTGTVAPTAVAGATLANTATVAAPSGTTDSNPVNNTATDTDTLAAPPTLPALVVLDNFNRANANTLNNGTNWSQATLLGQAGIRVNTNQASAAVVGTATWNSPAAGYGAKQGASFTFVNTTVNNAALILKGGAASTLTIPNNHIRVTYNNGVVTVATAITNGLTLTSQGTVAGTFASGDTLTAVADASGAVFVFKNATYLGHVAVPATGATAFVTGGGRIGVALPTGTRIDDFKGGNA